MPEFKPEENDSRFDPPEGHIEGPEDDHGHDELVNTEQLAQHSPLSTVSWLGEEVLAWVKTVGSAAVYATLIVTFGFQVARVEGKSMEPTLEDQDRLIVNKAVYRFFGLPEVGDTGGLGE